MVRWPGAIAVAVWIAVLGLAPANSVAQSYPDRAIQFVVPFPAGGATDVVARAVLQKLGDTLAKPVVVDNRPRTAATTGTDHID